MPVLKTLRRDNRDSNRSGRHDSGSPQTRRAGAAPPSAVAGLKVDRPLALPMNNPFSVFTFLIVCFTAAPKASSQELPLLGGLPQPGREWTLRERGTDHDRSYEYAWATFTNAKTGDILSFVADRYPNVVRKVGADAVRQAATDMFPGGYPRGFMRTPTQPTKPSDWMVIDVLRFNIVTLETGVEAGLENRKAEALQYSFVYEDRAKGLPNRLAHGYVIAFGDTVVFIQHTSAHVIESTDANSIALSMIRNHP